MSLLAAKENLARQRPELALPPLLNAWRQCKAPELADVIDQVSASVKRPPLEGSAKARHAEFLSLLAAGDPADGPRLLAFLGEGQTAHLVEALDALGKRPADPRFTGRALALMQKPPVTSSASFPAWRRLFALLASNGDLRALEPLKTLDFNAVLGPNQAYSATFFSERAQKTIAALTKLEAPRLSPADAELVAAMLGNRRAATRDLGALEAAVFAAPDDDGPRRVFCDALLERADPRGEFLTLQLEREQRRLTAPERAREMELLAEHRAAWLGPLELALDEWCDLVEFRRGFVHTLAVASDKPHAMKVLLEAPGFATVRTLLLRLDDESPLPVELLRSPALRHLTGLGGLMARSFAELFGASEPWPYTHLVCHEPNYEPAEFKRDLARLIGSRVTPKLVGLKISGYSIEPAALAPFWESENAKRLTGFGSSMGLYRLAKWVKEIEAHGLDARLRSFDLGFNFGARDFAAVLTRGADGRLSDLEVWKRPPNPSYGSPKNSRLATELESIPADRLTAFRYAGKLSKGDKKLLETALSRQRQLAVLELG